MRMEDLPLDDKDKRLGVQFAVGCGCFGELESVTSSVIGLKNVTMFNNNNEKLDHIFKFAVIPTHQILVITDSFEDALEDSE